MRTALLTLTILCICGCNNRIVRDSVVYETEVDFVDKVVQASAASLELFWKGKCACTEGKWGALMGSGISNAQCNEAGDIVLLVKSTRWQWHHLMARVNAGWELEEIKDLPTWFNPEKAPEIPALASLCEVGEEQ